jgi:hypothetical protein
VAALLGLAAYVCVVFARPTLALGLLPGLDTLELLTSLLREAMVDVEELAPPVPTRRGWCCWPCSERAASRWPSTCWR